MKPANIPGNPTADLAKGGSASAPFWSVMVPVYRPPEGYLRQALESVLQQDPGAGQMQIEVVDDCSPEGDSEAMVKAIGGSRVRFSKTPKNLGLAGCWNTCIERAHGRWVHILHQDDYVLPGFYSSLERASVRYSDVSFLAVRSFYIDDKNVITGVTERVPSLEKSGRNVDDLFYYIPFQCPGVAVRRAFYQVNGGFRSDLNYTLDCEMWARVISSAGGVIVPDVLACYRVSAENESSRLHRSAGSLQDMERLYEIFSEQYSSFDMGRAKKFLASLAARRLDHFRRSKDTEAVAANLAFWRRSVPLKWRIRHDLIRFLRSISG